MSVFVPESLSRVDSRCTPSNGRVRVREPVYGEQLHGWRHLTREYCAASRNREYD